MLRKILLLSLVALACNEARPYEIDSRLNCQGDVDGVRYRLSMYGTRHTNHECKDIGDCWGKKIDWEPQLLGLPSCAENNVSIESFDDDTCKSATMMIVIDRYAGTARLLNEKIDHAMQCYHYTEFRDQHG